MVKGCKVVLRTACSKLRGILEEEKSISLMVVGLLWQMGMEATPASRLKARARPKKIENKRLENIVNLPFLENSPESLRRRFDHAVIVDR